MRRPDNVIGEGLYKSGPISREDLEAYEGVHLRRMPQAIDQPLDYIDSQEKLIVNNSSPGKDIQRVSFNTLKRNLRELGHEVKANPGVPPHATGRLA